MSFGDMANALAVGGMVLFRREENWSHLQESPRIEAIEGGNGTRKEPPISLSWDPLAGTRIEGRREGVAPAVRVPSILAMGM